MCEGHRCGCGVMTMGKTGRGDGWATGKSWLTNGEGKFLTHQSPFVEHQPFHVHQPLSLLPIAINEKLAGHT